MASPSKWFDSPLILCILMYNFLFLFPSGLCKWGWWVRVSQYVVHFDFSQWFTYLPCVSQSPDNKYLWPSRMKNECQYIRRSVWLRGTGFRQAVIHLRKLEIEPGSVYLSEQAHVTPRVPNKLIYQHVYLIHNHDISMHCTYHHYLIYQLQWARAYSLSLPIIGHCYPLATCRRALLLTLEIASCARHHEFVSCYDRKACLHRIIFVSVRSMPNKFQNSFCMLFSLVFSQNMRESTTGGLYYKATSGMYDGITPETWGQ